MGGPTPMPTQSDAPTASPTSDPTLEPTVNPVTSDPTMQPTLDPVAPSAPDISVTSSNGGSDNLDANGSAKDEAANAANGIIPGTNLTVSILILAAAALIILACCVLGAAYFFDKARKKNKMRAAEHNISSNYNNVAMSPTTSKQKSVAFSDADEEAGVITIKATNIVPMTP